MPTPNDHLIEEKYEFPYPLDPHVEAYLRMVAPTPRGAQRPIRRPPDTLAKTEASDQDRAGALWDYLGDFA